VLIFLSALLAPWLGLADPYQGSMIRRLRHIGTPNYPLGTTNSAATCWRGLIYGGRLSLIIGILPVILAFMIGTSLGLVAAMSAASSTPRSCAHRRVLRVPLGAAGDRDFPVRSAPASSIPSSR